MRTRRQIKAGTLTPKAEGGNRGNKRTPPSAKRKGKQQTPGGKQAKAVEEEPGSANDVQEADRDSDEEVDALEAGVGKDQEEQKGEEQQVSKHRARSVGML